MEKLDKITSCDALIFIFFYRVIKNYIFIVQNQSQICDICDMDCMSSLHFGHI
jgi:hypothetical protein